MNKLNARTVVIDGISFRSALEGRRYSQLKLLESGGYIRDLELQPEYPLIITNLKNKAEKKCGKYHADFRYYDIGLRDIVIEDVKGIVTEAAALRIKIVNAMYGIEIALVRKDDM